VNYGKERNEKSEMYMQSLIVHWNWRTEAAGRTAGSKQPRKKPRMKKKMIKITVHYMFGIYSSGVCMLFMAHRLYGHPAAGASWPLVLSGIKLKAARDNTIGSAVSGAALSTDPSDLGTRQYPPVFC
jgi:hypothetical protein